MPALAVRLLRPSPAAAAAAGGLGASAIGGGGGGGGGGAGGGAGERAAYTELVPRPARPALAALQATLMRSLVELFAARDVPGLQATLASLVDRAPSLPLRCVLRLAAFRAGVGADIGAGVGGAE